MIQLLAIFIIVCIIALIIGLIEAALNAGVQGFWSFARTDTGSLILSLITFALIWIYYVNKKSKQNK